MRERRRRLAEILSAEGLPALLVSRPENIRYLSGFTGEGLLLVGGEETVVFTDFRYLEQAESETGGLPVLELKEAGDRLREEISRLGAREVGFEADAVTVGRLSRWQEGWAREITLRPTRGLVERLRRVKDAGEIRRIRRAGELAANALAETVVLLRPGLTERDVALELEYRLRRAGAEGPAFTFIVASGPRGALPHGVAGERKLEAGDLLTIDCGAVFEGYRSDMTRTVAIVKVSAFWRRIYERVKEAQARGIALVRAGAVAGEVDAEVRRFFAADGLAERFGHGLGHGVGLEIHEEPRLGPGSETVLESGMVVTVEPGLYLPGRGGVRIEDTVAVLEGGAEILTPGDKELRIVG